MHWAEQYVGKKWVRGARGPDTFDCWGLLQWCYSKHYGVVVPDVLIDWSNNLQVDRAIDSATKSTHWKRLEKPIDGCAVALSTNVVFHHVGLYLDVDKGAVLHTRQEANCVFQNLSHLRSTGWKRIEFYIPTSWPTFSK